MSTARIFSHSGLTSAAMLALNVASGILAARVLSVEGRGLLGIIMFWPQLVGDILCPPLSDATVVHGKKNGPKEFVERLWGGFISASVWAVGAALVAVPTLLAAILLFSKEKLGDAWLMSLVFGIVYILTTFIVQPFLGFMRATDRYGIVNATRISVPALYFSAAGIFSLGGVGLVGFVLALIISRVLTLSAQIAIAFKTIKIQRRWTSQGLSKTILGLWGASIVSIASSNIDRTVMMLTADTAWIGGYVVAMTVATPVNGLVSTLLHSVGLPQLLSVEERSRSAAYEKLLRITLTLSLISAAIIAAATPILLPVVFGAKFKFVIGLTIGLCLVFVLTPIRVAMRPILLAENAARGIMLGEITYIATFIIVFAAFYFPLSELALLPAIGIANGISVYSQWKILKGKRPDLSVGRWFLFGPKSLPELVGVIRSGLRKSR